MRMKQLEEDHALRAATKAANFALRYGASVKTIQAQSEMWQHAQMMPVNKMEVVLLKSAVMMLDVMGNGVPEYWGKPYKKTKYLYYWKDINDSRTAIACLSDKMWDFFPAGSFFVSWTNSRGTERHHIGDAKKFSMCVGAPRFGDNFVAPFFDPSHDDCGEEEWQGKWAFDEEDDSK